MSCHVCGNKDGPCGDRKSNKSSVRIHLRTGFEDLMNVPCFARDKFHDATKNRTVILVENDDNEFYCFQVDKRSFKTRIFGEEYKEFLEHYNMKRGDNVKIYLGNPCKLGYFYMEAYDRNGHAKERVEEEFDFLDRAKSLVVTSGLNLTYTQISKVNKHVQDFGLGLGVVFVHRINESNVAQNMMHIPKEAAKKLEIPSRGYVVHEMQVGRIKFTEQADYYTSTDKRIHFQSGWKKFAKEVDLVPADVVVMLFHKNTPDEVHIIMRRAS